MTEKKVNLSILVQSLLKSVHKDSVSEDHLWYALRGALNPALLVSNLSEALRISAAETEELLIQNGLSDLVMQARLKAEEATPDAGEEVSMKIADAPVSSPFPDLFSIETIPSLHDPLWISHSRKKSVSDLVKSILSFMSHDPFLDLYRIDVKKYHDDFLKREALQIDRYVDLHFGKNGLKYLVNSGIGANEQFNHFISYINNINPGKKSEWIIVNSPRQLERLPQDASVSNTLFMEFSRSGKTEETVKVHEYTPREMKRIVFANSGPLKDLGLRDKNLALFIPDEVSGRFGRNKTPILLAPMYVAGMDTHTFWEDIENAIHTFNLQNPDNLPFQIAKFIYIYQMINKINHIYLGCNDDRLLMLADEFAQFWNEGVNKGANDILMSRYLGLPRDSHTNIEGMLANHKNKMAVFLFTDNVMNHTVHPLIRNEIDPINPEHIGLEYGEEELILAEANYERFSELMPCIKIMLHGAPNLNHAAVISQLWSDITFCYSRLKNIDPGSNPEVKAVRDRSAHLLAQAAKHSMKTE